MQYMFCENKIRYILFLMISVTAMGYGNNEIDWTKAEAYTAESLYSVTPQRKYIRWSVTQNGFWYVDEKDTGKEYFFFDMKKRRSVPLFTDTALVVVYNAINKDTIARKDLRIYDLNLDRLHKGIITFPVNRRYWDYQIKTKSLSTSSYKEPSTRKDPFSLEKYSSDSLYVLTGFGDNLYVRKRMDTLFNQITFNGTSDFSFTNSSSKTPVTQKVSPGAYWLPGTHSLFHLRDDRSKVKQVALINSLAKGRPTYDLIRMPMPGDKETPEYTLSWYNADKAIWKEISIDRYPGQKVETKYHPSYHDTGKSLYFTRRSRAADSIDLCRVSAVSEDLEVVIHEEMKPHQNLQLFNYAILRQGKEFLWWSERNGKGQYFLYDEKGICKNAVTPENLVAGEICQIDTLRRKLIFAAYGRSESSNPSYRYYYKVGFDGKGLTLLTPGDGHHEAEISPDGRYLYDCYSRMDKPFIGQVVNLEGTPKVSRLYQTDDALLRKQGWCPPTLFRVKAADNTTDLYGIMYTPFGMDSTKTYPIISNVYPGPQDDQIPLSFTVDDNQNQSLAQLGFIVVNVAPRGSSPYRGRDFHCFGYGNLRDYPLADDKYSLEQLAARYRFIDLGRIGIFGHSGGGFMTATAMMTYPDFYKVGIATSGNYDNNIYINWWAEVYQGIQTVQNSRTGGYDFKVKIPTVMELAPNLKGHLLLITGDMDRNVPPSSTYRLANALIKAGKQFDMLVIPGAEHGLGGAYYYNKIRYYFLQHLKGVPCEDIDINKHR